ncbi:hypothetical protein BZL41_16400 [Pseudomonas sp. PIC25]|uniref:hypothetical protein n=1 Tax=Pseudomonas sp. PIC25 TaxID=1958773 RepID=UPI000BAB3886|nr:hypothetical protein [Pseudomonas sp. PIC25]PAU59712.1 hypothetical protein BZL41_16400 [Pseudomonas sp. PIC25]
MRYHPLLALFASLAVTLPAVAADWPAGGKADFIKECVASSKATHGEDAAKDYCECAADKVSDEFSEAEMEELHSKTGITPQMQQRLVSASSSCLSELNQE